MKKVILYDTNNYLADINKQWAKELKSQYIKDFGKEPTQEQINDIMEQKRETDCDNVLNKIENGNFILKEQTQISLNLNNDSPIFKDKLEYLIAEKCPNGYERIQIGVNENQNLFVIIKNANEKASNIEVKTLTKDSQSALNYTTKKQLWNNPKFTQKIKIDGIKYTTNTKQKSKSNEFEREM